MADKLPVKPGESVFQNINQSPRHKQEMKKSSFFVAVEGGGNSLKFSEDSDGSREGRRGSGSGSGRNTPDMSSSPRRPRKPMGSFFNTIETGGDTFQFPSERGEGRPKRRGSNNGSDTDVNQSPRRVPRAKNSMFATVEGGGNSLQFDSEKPKSARPTRSAEGSDVSDSPKRVTPEAAAEPIFEHVDGGQSTLEVSGTKGKAGQNPSPVFDEVPDHTKRSPRHSANPLTHSDDEVDSGQQEKGSPTKTNGIDGPAVKTKPKKEYVDWVMYQEGVLCQLVVLC